MKLEILIIAGVASTAAFLSLCVYIFLAVWGKSITLYSTSRESLLSWKQKVFLALAALAFLACMYKGAEFMLWWIPSDWGGLDESGDYKTLSSSLAFSFMCIGGIAFIHFIDTATHDKFSLRLASEKTWELERILNAAINARELPRLMNEYSEKLSAITPKETYVTNYMLALTESRLPEGRRAQMYRELIFYVEQFESKNKATENSAS